MPSYGGQAESNVINKQRTVEIDSKYVDRQRLGRRAAEMWTESVATLPPFSPIEGQKWFDQISSQWESQRNRFALIYFGKIQFLPPCIWNLPFMSTASVRCYMPTGRQQPVGGKEILEQAEDGCIDSWKLDRKRTQNIMRLRSGYVMINKGIIKSTRKREKWQNRRRHSFPTSYSLK